MSAAQPDVHIVTDSTADIPESLLESLPITVVPLSVEIDGTVYSDGVDLTREDFLGHLESGALPRTSQPSVGVFQDTYDEILKRGQHVVSIHIASTFSGTVNSATQARAGLESESVYIVDSGTVSMGLGFLALEAADRAINGASASSIAEFLERRKHDQRLYATLETLEYLRKGGRIGRAAAMLGSALQLKPVVQVRDGVVEPVERVRTYRKALERLARMYGETGPYDRVAVLHLGAQNEADRLVERIRQSDPELEILVGQIGTVIGAYGGPGVVGFTGLVRRGPE